MQWLLKTVQTPLQFLAKVSHLAQISASKHLQKPPVSLLQSQPQNSQQAKPRVSAASAARVAASMKGFATHPVQRRRCPVGSARKEPSLEQRAAAACALVEKVGWVVLNRGAHMSPATNESKLRIKWQKLAIKSTLIGTLTTPSWYCNKNNGKMWKITTVPEVIPRNKPILRPRGRQRSGYPQWGWSLFKWKFGP